MQFKTIKLLYELLDNVGIRSFKDAHEVVNKMRKRDFVLIYEHLESIYENIDEDIKLLGSSNDLFKVVPTGYMNVEGPFICHAPECRLKALHSSFKRLVFNADVVVFNDLLLAPLHNLSIGKGVSKIIRQDFVVALWLVFALKHVADAGMLLFVPNEGNWDFCEDCMHEAISGANINLDNALNIFLNNNRLMFSQEENNSDAYLIRFKMNDPAPHDLVTPFDNNVFLTSLKKKLGHLKTDKELGYELTKREVKKYGLINKEISKICLQLNWANTLAENIEGSVLTDSNTEWDILNSEKSIISHKEKGINFEIPFMDQININDLITIRKSEPVSFEKLRIALSQVKSDFFNKQEISEKELKYYINHKLLPEIKIVNEDLKNIKRKTLVKGISLAAISTLFTSIGFYEGAFSPSLLSAFQQIGYLGIALEGIHLCSEHSQKYKEIRGNAPYFLWKIKDAIKH
jgi:hypothetical protein